MLTGGRVTSQNLSRPYCSFFESRKYRIFTIDPRNWQWYITSLARYRHIMVGETSHYFCFGFQHRFRILFGDFAIEYCTSSDLMVIPSTQYFANSTSNASQERNLHSQQNARSQIICFHLSASLEQCEHPSYSRE